MGKSVDDENKEIDAFNEEVEKYNKNIDDDEEEEDRMNEIMDKYIAVVNFFISGMTRSLISIMEDPIMKHKSEDFRNGFSFCTELVHKSIELNKRILEDFQAMSPDERNKLMSDLQAFKKRFGRL